MGGGGGGGGGAGDVFSRSAYVWIVCIHLLLGEQNLKNTILGPSAFYCECYLESASNLSLSTVVYLVHRG